jgi:hypothetical protein
MNFFGTSIALCIALYKVGPNHNFKQISTLKLKLKNAFFSKTLCSLNLKNVAIKLCPNDGDCQLNYIITLSIIIN